MTWKLSILHGINNIKLCLLITRKQRRSPIERKQIKIRPCFFLPNIIHQTCFKRSPLKSFGVYGLKRFTKTVRGPNRTASLVAFHPVFWFLVLNLVNLFIVRCKCILCFGEVDSLTVLFFVTALKKCIVRFVKSS